MDRQGWGADYGTGLVLGFGEMDGKAESAESVLSRDAGLGLNPG